MAASAASLITPGASARVKTSTKAEPVKKSRAERRRLDKPRGVHAGPVTHRARVKGHSLADQRHEHKREIARRLRQQARLTAQTD